MAGHSLAARVIAMSIISDTLLRVNIKHSLSAVAIVVAVAALVAFGLLGVGRGGGVAFADVRYFYLAAQMVSSGLNPYSYPAFSAFSVAAGLGADIGVFPYPPHSLLLWLPLTWFPIEVARWIWTGANLIVLALVAGLMGRWFASRVSGHAAPSVLVTSAWIPAIIIGNPFTAHLVWTAQTGLLVLGCLLVAWYGLNSGRALLAGIFLGLASIKPQLSILVILWVLFTGHFRILAIAGVTAAALLVFPLVAIGSAAVTDWWQAALAYQGEVSGALAYIINLRSLIVGLAIPVLPRVVWVLPVLAVLYVAAMAFQDRKQPFNRGDVFASLLVTSLLFVFGRDYDIAVLAPVVPALWWYSRGSNTAKAFGLAILVLLVVPQRVVSQAGVPALQFWRIALLGALWLWLTAAMWRGTFKFEPSRPTFGHSA